MCCLWGSKQAAIAAEAAVEKKVEFIRRDQERRVQALEERQERMLKHAQLAEAWADDVEKVRSSNSSSSCQLNTIRGGIRRGCETSSEQYYL